LAKELDPTRELDRVICTAFREELARKIHEFGRFFVSRAASDQGWGAWSAWPDLTVGDAATLYWLTIGRKGMVTIAVLGISNTDIIMGCQELDKTIPLTDPNVIKKTLDYILSKEQSQIHQLRKTKRLIKERGKLGPKRS